MITGVTRTWREVTSADGGSPAPMPRLIVTPTEWIEMKYYRRLACFVLAIVVLLLASAGVAAESRKSVITEVDPGGAGRTVSGAEASGAPPLPVLMPLAPKLLSLDKVCRVAYLDAFNILKDDNSCSRFFGGSKASVDVLNNLALRMQKKPLGDQGIGIRMWGQSTFVKNVATGFSYRLFDNALVNANGPFYSHPPLGAASARNRSVGRFPSHTREAKVLMLLHELGHMIQGPDGNWLIPDDNKSHEQNLKNTMAIEAQCGKQIRSRG